MVTKCIVLQISAQAALSQCKQHVSACKHILSAGEDATGSISKSPNCCQRTNRTSRVRAQADLDGWKTLHIILAAQWLIALIIAINCCNCSNPLKTNNRAHVTCPMCACFSCHANDTKHCCTDTTRTCTTGGTRQNTVQAALSAAAATPL